MSKLYTKIYNYLFVIIGIFLMSSLAITFCWLNFQKEQKPTFAIEGETTGFWLDEGNYSTIDLGEQKSFDISTPEQFAGVCAAINSATDASIYADVTFNITNDLDFSAHYWVPIGFPSDFSTVRAKFVAKQANNQDTVKISGLKIDNTKEDFALEYPQITSFGLFGVVDKCVQAPQGFIKGLELENISINIDISKVNSTTINIGSVAGYFAGQKEKEVLGASEAGMVNCCASGTITVFQSSEVTGKTVNVGGIVGNIAALSGSTSGATVNYTSVSATQSNQSNAVEISVSGGDNKFNIGGIAGLNNGTIAGTNETIISNLSSITTDTGYCGIVAGANSATGTVKNLASGVNIAGVEPGTTVQNAKITASSNDTKASFCAGGIVGSNKGIVQNCTNYATLSTYQGVLGGIVGENTKTVTNCKNAGAVGIDGSNIPQTAINSDGQNLNTTIIFGGIVGKNCTNATISLCKNNGNVGGLSRVDYLRGVLGGVSGYNYANATIKNCVNYATIGGAMYAQYAGGITGTNTGVITSEPSLSDTDELKITTNLGEVYANSYAGGISGGWNSEGLPATPTIEISNCYNKGKIDGVSKNNNASAILGGVLGTARNCQLDSKITNCINLGKVGSINAVGIAGGLVGEALAKFTMQNCANYGELSAAGSLGGVIGNIETSTAPIFNFVLATGAISPRDDNTNIGGICGKISSSASIDNDSLAKIMFDLGVLGYDLPPNLPGYKANKLYRLNLVGAGNAQAQFSLPNSPVTYYMTAPGAWSNEGNDYYTKYFSNSGEWHFHSADIESQRYYYPVPQIFQDNGIFVEDTSESSQNLLLTPYPSQLLSKVVVENRLPIEWDVENDTELVKKCYVNIYSDLLPDSAKSGVLAGEGQYIITGQKLSKPTESKTIYYRSNFESESEFDEQMNSLGWAGNYNIHEGFRSEFRDVQAGNEYNFDSVVDSKEINIAITWVPRDFEVQLYVYNYDKNIYEQQKREGQITDYITYSLKPGSKQTINLLSTIGKTYYGWRLDNSLLRTNYMSEEAWITAWENDSTTEFDSNRIYSSGLKLYGMSTLQKISLTLQSGEVSTPSGSVTGVFDGVVTEMTEMVRFGVAQALPKPTIGLENYSFEGYYDLSGNKLTGADAVYTHTSAELEFALVAHWTYTIKYVTYVTKVGDTEVVLKQVETDYNEKLALSNQANEQNMLAWGIDYTNVEPTLDSNGYKYAGVFSDPECENPFDYNQVITSDLTLYIGWEQLKFTLTLNANIGYDLSNNWRDGGWGEAKAKNITLQVPYNVNLTTYLLDWKINEPTKSSLSVTGFDPIMLGNGYNWSLVAVPMGNDFETEVLLSENADKNFMPANNNLILYVLWSRMSYDMVFNANGGYFPNSTSDPKTTVTAKVFYEANLKNAISNIDPQFLNVIKQDDSSKWVFKYWSFMPNGAEIPSNAIMGTACTVYAIYGEQRTVRFYVGGATPSNLIGEVDVYDGAILGQMPDTMADLNQKIQRMLTDSESGQSAFELDYWVEMVYDESYNATESKEAFDFNKRVINENINLLAKLKPNANYVPPSKDTTNYIIIAGVVIIAALILLFIVLVARPAKASLTLEKKAKNKEIQAQLDEIKELERRRRNMENPYD